MTDLLAIGRSGVLAYRDALATVGENVVNADTDGYAKRKVTLKEQSAPGDAYSLNKTRSSLNGVQAVDVQRVWDQYKAQNAWSAGSEAGEAEARSKWLSTVETMLNDSDSGVGTKLTAVFTSANALAAAPSDNTLRQGMLSALGDAAATLRQTAGNLAKVSDSASLQANQIVQTTNDNVTALARVNTALRATAMGTESRAQLEDQRDALIGSISSNIGVDVSLLPSGAATLTIGGFGGATLLSGVDSATELLGVTTAADGQLSLTRTNPSGVVTSANTTSGALAGLMSAASTLAGRRTQLDALAADFAGGINTWQAGGTDANGAPGGDLLGNGLAAPTVPPTPITASNITLATSDVAKIAAAVTTTTASGTTVAENANLLALPATMRGKTGVEAGWRSLVTDQALLVSSAKSQATAATNQKDGGMTALDEVSGINLDSEAADLLRFQQAYSASSKIIQTARDAFQAVLDLF